MKTSINGKAAEWPDEVKAKWDTIISDPGCPNGKVTNANYFMPRPYRNEYDRGSEDEGFVYTINFRNVWICYLEH